MSRMKGRNVSLLGKQESRSLLPPQSPSPGGALEAAPKWVLGRRSGSLPNPSDLPKSLFCGGFGPLGAADWYSICLKTEFRDSLLGTVGLSTARGEARCFLRLTCAPSKQQVNK